MANAAAEAAASGPGGCLSAPLTALAGCKRIQLQSFTRLILAVSRSLMLLPGASAMPLMDLVGGTALAPGTSSCWVDASLPMLCWLHALGT